MRMANAPSWRISTSTELALDWAAWFCGSRGGSEIDSIDVLLGLLFAHPDSSEPVQLLDHFRLSGAAFTDAILQLHPNHRVTSTSNIPTAPPRRSPSLAYARDAIAVLDRATQLALEVGADNGMARDKDVFGAMLVTPDTSVRSALGGLFEVQSVSYDFSKIGSDYQDFLKAESSGDYAAFLESHSPYTPRVLALPRFDADMAQPSGRDGDSEDIQLIPDLVDIGGEVNAFAHLLTATDLQPPLAIGLFGDWGSGKSFFMRELQRRIYQITDRARQSEQPQSKLPIFKSVAQIEFNAWHYVEGNLWASLVDHIFQNLRTSADDKEPDLIERREKLAQEVASTQLARAQVEQEIKVLRKQKCKALVDERRLRRQRRAAVSTRSSIGPVTTEILTSALAKPEVAAAAKNLGLGEAFGSAQQFASAVHDARLTVQMGGGLIGRLRTQGWKHLLALVAGAVVLVFGVSALLFLAGIDGVRNLVASATALLGFAAAIVRDSSVWMRARLDDLERVEGALAEVQRADELERAGVTREVQEIDTKLAAARAQATALDSHVGELQRSLVELSPGQLLASFIDRRAASDDYRRFLGVPAIVRRDFEELSRRLVKANKDFVKADDGRRELDKHAVNRIVLYVDDLDRCPPAVVVKVLQAVHLLLAFPLFVVVVAVDSRWLANSLEQHYAHLLSPRRGPDAQGDHLEAGDGHAVQASPDDYLEKIFQIPFRVRELNDGARRRIIEGLIAPSLVLDGHGGNGDSGDATANEPIDLATLRRTQERVFGRDGGDTGINADSLQIHAHELELMKSLAPITGDSPRAVKRFVNVYRLMKGLSEPQHSSFAHDAAGAPYQYVMFLLAIVTGLPAISAELLAEIRQPQPRPDRDRLLQVAELIQTRAVTSEAKSQSAALLTWVKVESKKPIEAKHYVWESMLVKDLEPWVDQVARFSFASEVARPVLASAPSPT
jgi:hypothetical protein